MNKKYILEIAEKIFEGIPIKVIRKKIGICNEVYELIYESSSFILRMNKEKEWMFGTHKFIPLFRKLDIKVPVIISEDYSKTKFPFCYQIQTKIEGKDLAIVFTLKTLISI